MAVQRFVYICTPRPAPSPRRATRGRRRPHSRSEPAPVARSSASGAPGLLTSTHFQVRFHASQPYLSLSSFVAGRSDVVVTTIHATIERERERGLAREGWRERGGGSGEAGVARGQTQAAGRRAPLS